MTIWNAMKLKFLLVLSLTTDSSEYAMTVLYACLIIILIYCLTVLRGVPFDSYGGGPGFDPRVFLLFFQLGGGGVEYFFFFCWEWSTFFFWSELHVHFAGCHILLLVQYYFVAIIVGLSGGGGVQSQIQNFMVWIFMGSNLSLRGVWGSCPKKI